MKRILMIFAATAAVVSCRKTEELIQPQAPEVTITAEHLKTVIDDKGAVTWDGDEMISVLFKKGTEEFHVEQYENENEAGLTAKFVGTIKGHVTIANGWNDVAYCVCPSLSVDDKTGTVKHSLPAEQYAHASVDGSFETGLNLSYAPISLEALENQSQEKVMFENALSVLRLVPGSDDITSITINASDPLVGEAPMVFDSEGKLVIDSDGTWGESSNSVVLRPSEDNECFTKGVTYNILVYPGAHTSFSVTLNYKEYGDYTKRLKSAPTFAPAKYYTIGFTSDSEVIITEMSKDVADLESSLPNLDDLERLEENVEALLGQIQSISLMSEYIENAAYAKYSLFGSKKQKQDIELSYMIRPVSVAEQLVENYSESMSALLSRKDAQGQLSFATLPLNGVNLDGDIMTVKIDATGINDDVYDGIAQGQIALQIAASRNDFLSDFAKLYPKKGAGLDFTRTTDIPVIRGALVSIPFKYAPNGDTYSLTVSGNQNAWCKDNTGLFSGYIYVNIKDADLATQSVTVALDSGDDRIETKLTFAEAGYFNVAEIPQIDYVGGNVSINVDYDKNFFNANTYNLQINNGSIRVFDIGSPTDDNPNGTYHYYPWIYETNPGVSGYYTVDSNTELYVPQYNNKGEIVNSQYLANSGDSERSATVVFNIKIKNTGVYGDLAYTLERTITQKKKGSAITQQYYKNGDVLQLNSADSKYNTPFNIVILGDGYQMKDLQVGGKFETSARSAMDSFFAIEPYTTFKDRFNVYMVAYESVDEGTDIKSSGINKNTYFGSYCQGGGNTAAYVADAAPVINAVKAVVGSADAQYYRSIAILLINTNEQAGSTGYPFRDSKSDFVNGYASFAIAALAANSTGTNGLIKHEAGGHAFGRLADEYYSGSETVTDAKKKELDDWHKKGWYWNVTSSTTDGYYKFTGDAYTGVGFVEGAWGYKYGLYCPTVDGMMQGNTGKFNAPCRHAIYHRIITESEGVGAYAFWKFAQYDQKNR